MTRTSPIVIAALAAVGSATFAHAGFIETASTRLVRTDAVATGLQDGVHTIFGPSIYGVMNDDVSSFQSGDAGAYGNGFAYQNTTISAGAYSGVVEAIASADPGSSGFDIVNGYASSELYVEFTVTGTTEFDLSGNGGGFGTVNGALRSHSYVAIESLGGGTATQVFLQEDDLYTTFAGSGTLLAGDYRFVVTSTTIIDFIFDSGPFIEGNASVTFDLTFVPAPSTAALFGLAGLTATRRRR